MIVYVSSTQWQLTGIIIIILFFIIIIIIFWIVYSTTRAEMAFLIMHHRYTMIISIKTRNTL